MDTSLNFPIYILLIAFASSLGIPLGATFFIVSAGSQSAGLEGYFFFTILIFSGLVIGDTTAYALGSYFERVFTQKIVQI